MKVAPRTAASAANKGNKDATALRHQAVYNWTTVHSVDFWSLVLSAACDPSSHIVGDDESAEAAASRVASVDTEAELRPLIYPLVQVTLGLIRLVPSSRYFPLRFQLINSLLRVMQRTGIYIPLAPFMLEVLDSSEISSNKNGRRKGSANSSLKPLDWAYYVRAPSAYPHTRIYADGLIEEVSHLLLEFLTISSTSIAFPELSIPISVALKKHLRKSSSKNQKLASALRQLCERIDANSSFIQTKRASVEFSPADRTQVDSFLADLRETSKTDEKYTPPTPLGTFLKLQRKIRDQKRDLLEKSLQDDEDEQDGLAVEDGSDDDDDMDEQQDEEMSDEWSKQEYC